MGDSDANEIRGLQDEFVQAWLHHDGAALDRLVADDFVIVTAGKGLVQPKNDWISGAVSRYTPTSHDHQELWLRVHGDTATVTWRYSEDASDELLLRLYGDAATVNAMAPRYLTPEGRRRAIGILVTDVWARVGNRWQVVARHSSIPASN